MNDALATFRTLYTSEVVERVRPEGIWVSHDYRAISGAIPLPSTLSMELAKLLGKIGGITTRLYSDYPFPLRADSAGGALSGLERRALARLRQDPTEPVVEFYTDSEGNQSEIWISRKCRSSH